MKDNGQLKPSLKDYTAFHGMFCGPEAARRCIQSFQGTILFAGQDDYDAFVVGDNNLADFDLIAIPVVELNLWTYYLLVILSLTGLCSALGCTKVISSLEYVNNDGDEDTPCDTPLRFKKGCNLHIESSKTSTKPPLRLPSKAMEYAIDQSIALGPVSTKNTAKEQTDSMENSTKSVAGKGDIPKLTLIRRFEYDFGGFLSVMMLHFLCTNGRTHLLEIYRLDTGTTAGFIANTMLNVLHGLKSLVIKLLHPQQQLVDGAKKTA